MRTTIVLRRGQRRAKIEELKHAAEKRLAEAGQRGAEAGAMGVEAARKRLKQAGGEARKLGAHLGAAVVRRAGAAAGAARLMAGRGVAGLSAELARARARRSDPESGAPRRWSADSIERLRGMLDRLPALALPGSFRLPPRLARLARPELGLPLFIAGIAALSGAIYRLADRATDPTALAVSLLAVGLLAFALVAVTANAAPAPRWMPTLRVGRVAARFDSAPRPKRPLVQWAVAGGLALSSAVAVIAAGAMAGLVPGDTAVVADGGAQADRGRATAETRAVSGQSADLGGSVKGYARSLSGDSLRIGSATLKLANIEAPALTQTCTAQGRRPWSCGKDALAALRRITGRRSVDCSIEGRDRNGRTIAACRVGGKDIAARLVADGHAVAVGGGLIAARYASEEAEARARRAGLWASDEPPL
ncbi:MAG: thermonuclease family protein [Hyphomicrobiaceae bacterium]|nr:thermonuclease family protein [Hyphomicrobiaceae bacterium]